MRRCGGEGRRRREGEEEGRWRRSWVHHETRERVGRRSVLLWSAVAGGCTTTYASHRRARRREARIVVADVVHHSDHMLRIACKVLVQHGETPEEREDARILLVIVDSKTPGRAERHRTEPDVQR